MHIKHIHCIIEKLAECAKHEVDKGVESLDTKEMGEVAEILKELCEAEYYAKISKAMDESEYGKDYDEEGPMEERKYYRGQRRDSRGRFMSNRGRRGYEEPMYYTMTPEMMKAHDPEYYRDMDRMEGRMYYAGGSGGSGSSGGGSMSSSGMGGGMSSSGMSVGSRNYGGESSSRSENARRGYEETKMMQDGSPEAKKKAMESLEHYMKELGEDLTEMVKKMDNSEKAMLKQKLQVLNQKIQ